MTRLEVCERIDVDYRAQILENQALQQMVTNRERTVTLLANRVSTLEVQLQKSQQFGLAEHEENKRLKERQGRGAGLATVVFLIGFVLGVAAQ